MQRIACQISFMPESIEATEASQRQFESERLAMRLLCADDAGLYARIYGSDELMQFVGKPMTASAAERSFASSLKSSQSAALRVRYWVMIEKASGASVGLLGLVLQARAEEPSTAEIGTMILPAWHARGYAAEGLAALMRYAYCVENLHVLRGMQMPQHLVSIRLMTRLGFRRAPDVIGHAHSLRWILERPAWDARQAAASSSSGPH